MRRRTILGFLSLVTVLGLARPVLADGTLLGTVNGRVKDESGAALPGVAVSVVSDTKGVQRDATTDSGGLFNFPLLEPGSYTVRAALSGFQSFESSGNIVTAEKTTQVPVTLKLATARESVTVSGDVPLVDKTNTSDTTHIDASLTDKLPVARAYQSVIEFAPGINDADADGNTNSHGATDSSNLFLFDGVDTTDPTTGTFGANNNFDAIQEVVVSNAGISAEYGRAQGAIVNVVTKTGTNEIHGSARVLITNDNWNDQNKGRSPLDTNPDSKGFARTKIDENVYDYLFTLGGPIWKDHVWFFGAYERNPQVVPPAQTQISGNPVNATVTGENYTANRVFRAWQGKINAQVTPSHSLTAQFQSDPFDGIIRDYWGGSAEREALTAQSQSTDCGWHCIWQARYSGVFGSKVSAEASYAQQRGGIIVNSFEGHGSPYLSLEDSLFYNGATFDGFVKRPRNQANAAVNLYTQLFGHSHQFKVGVDYQYIKSESSFTYPNNEIFIVSGFNAVTRQPILSVGDQWFQGAAAAASVSTGDIYGFYALDRFEATDRLSFNIGARVDKQTGKSDLRQSVVDSTTISPRLTGTFDLFGNGKTVASAAYGRYYDFLVQNIIDSIYSGVPQLTNFDEFLWNGTDWEFNRAIRGGGNTQPVNNGLDPSHLDEFNVAFQQQIGNTVGLGVRGIYRKWDDLIDDARFLDADGNKITTPRNFSSDVLKRRYRALEFTAEKRFSQNWQVLANYTLSRADGNHESTFASQLFDYANENCTVDPQGNAPEVTGNCADLLAHNRDGILSYDITSAVKVFAAYTLPLSIVNLTAAPSFVFLSGLPYQQTRNLDVGGDQDFYYDTKKGSSRLPNWYQLNFSLEAAFKIFGPVQIAVKGDVFNVTNQQTVIDSTRIRLIPDNNFGAPTSRNALNAPRAYQLSGVVRF